LLFHLALLHKVGLEKLNKVTVRLQAAGAISSASAPDAAMRRSPAVNGNVVYYLHRLEGSLPEGLLPKRCEELYGK